MLCSLTQPVIVNIFAQESFLTLLELNSGSFPASANIANIVLDCGFIEEALLRNSLLHVWIFDVPAKHSRLSPLDEFLWRGEARSVCILCNTLHWFLWVKEVLCSGLTFHLAFIEDLTKRGSFLFEEMEIVANLLVCLVAFAD